MAQGVPQGAAAPMVPDPTCLDATHPENFERFVQGKQPEHSQAFPMSDDMLTLFFIKQSELTEGDVRPERSSATPFSSPPEPFCRIQISIRAVEVDPKPYILEQRDCEGETGFIVCLCCVETKVDLGGSIWSP